MSTYECYYCLNTFDDGFGTSGLEEYENHLPDCIILTSNRWEKICDLHGEYAAEKIIANIYGLNIYSNKYVNKLVELRDYIQDANKVARYNLLLIKKNI